MSNGTNGTADVTLNGVAYSAARVRRNARLYLERGYMPIPVPFKSKNPNRDGWQNERPTLEDIDRLFPEGRPLNLGVLNGEPSGGLIDGDLDTAQAIAAAPYFLPPTGCVSGRHSKPRSHFWYVVEDPPEKAAVKFLDVDRTVVLELRSTGSQTVVPPSIHESGELVRWEEWAEGGPARVEWAELLAAAGLAAGAAILAKHWPNLGSRHDARLALAGGLARAGWDADVISRFVVAVTVAAGNEGVEDAKRVGPDTIRKLEAGENIVGWPRLKELLGARGADVLRKALPWMGVGAGSGGPATPRINAGNGNLAEVTGQAWEALGEANDPPTIFRYGGLPARIENDDDGNPLVRALTVERMRHRMARAAYWYVRKKRGESYVDEPAYPPAEVVKDVLATPDPPLPILTRIVGAPIFAADGTLQTAPGYSPASKTYYVPAEGLKVPDVSAEPSMMEVEEAAGLICDDLLGEFPFVGGDKAHAVAAFLCPFARELIAGPVPIHDFEAPTPGTGKTLMVNGITYPFLGRPATAMTEGRDEDEWRKRILAKLMGGPSVVLIDNVRRRVDAGALASAVTAYPLWEDRLLGKSEIVRVPVRCLWLMTGNNPAFSSEMARRTIRCRLDAKQDRPWLRTGFRHPNLMDWVEENRGRLMWAALTLIQAWIAADRPAGKKTLGMFEAWAQVMGGILDVADVRGFLGNLEEFYESADAEGATWRAFVGLWWNRHAQGKVKASDLYPLACEAGMQLGDKTEQSQKVRLGQKIAEARDRVFTVQVGNDPVSLRVEHAGTFRNAAEWRLVSCECVSVRPQDSHQDSHEQEF